MKILLVQTSFLGDNILSTPVVDGIKKLYPESELNILTTRVSSAVYSANPNIDKVLVYDKKGEHSGLMGFFSMVKLIKSFQFDRVYSLHRSYRTAILLYLSQIPERIGFKVARLSFLYNEKRERTKDLHEVKRNLQILAPEFSNQDSMPTRISLFPELSPEQVRIKYLESQSLEYAVLVPGSAWHTKRWFAAGYHKVAKELLNQGKLVVLLGAPSEAIIAKQVAGELPVYNLVGKTSIEEMFALVKGASLIVCNDSMSLHVASSFKVPTVAIFCATSPEFGFGPWENPKAVVVQKEDLECKPCRPHGSNACPLGTEACMTHLPAESVLGAVAEVTQG